MEWKTILKDDFSSLHVENIVELIEELNDYVKDLKKRDGIKWSIEQLMEIEEFLRKAEGISLSTCSKTCLRFTVSERGSSVQTGISLFR